jgi:preprotein translocase subunit YajC
MSWYLFPTLAQQDAPPTAPGDQQRPTEQQPSQPGNGSEGQPEQPPGFNPSFLIIMAVLLVGFWLLISLPQRRERKRREEMLAKLKKGDKVQTMGGIIGTVVDLRDQELVVKVDESNNVRMRFTRSAIQSVLDGGKPAQSES